MSQMPSDLLKSTSDCEEWHVKDYGDYLLYWCMILGGGQGSLPYDLVSVIKTCYQNQEYGWAGDVGVIPVPCFSWFGDGGKKYIPDDSYGRTACTGPVPDEFGEVKWWNPDIKDPFIMKVGVSADQPRTCGILWCPYLCTPGKHIITVDIWSPFQRGAIRSKLGRVRGWVPDHGCGPDNDDKHFVPCDTDYESPYCPVLTGCNSAGGMYVQLWTAGWGGY